MNITMIKIHVFHSCMRNKNSISEIKMQHRSATELILQKKEFVIQKSTYLKVHIQRRKEKWETSGKRSGINKKLSKMKILMQQNIKKEKNKREDHANKIQKDFQIWKKESVQEQ